MNKSKRRPFGFDNVDEMIHSLYESAKFDFTLYLIDNESNEYYDIPYDDIKYTYIENQIKNGAVTGAWNLGINQAIKDDCDIIIEVNDDIIFNDSINNLVDEINNSDEKDITIFSCVTDNVSLITQKQTDEKTKLNVNKFVGFLIAFTREFYIKYEKNGKLFNPKPKYMWAHQEMELGRRVLKSGGYIVIIRNCFVNHKHLCTWKKLDKKHKYKRIYNEYRKRI
jgi:hypothetical protein